MLWVLAAVQIWIAHESEKVRPDARPPAVAAAPRIRLAAAGGECVGAQIVVRGPATALTADTPSTVFRLYRVYTLRLEHPSGPDGAAGEWPDALIPARDVLYDEERRAFPVDVPEGRAQAVFVEACVPRGARGRLGGTVRFQWHGGGLNVPVEVRLRAFDLPQRPALATAFGFSGYSAAKGHHEPPEARRELTRDYDRIALRRGITLMGGTQDPPDFRLRGDDVVIDWRSYDAEVGPFLDAGWTSIELREPGKLNRAQRRSYRRQWVEHFRQRGWLDRLFRYVEDEPAEKNFPRVEEKAREFAEDAPDVARLVTTRPSGKLPDVSRFTPVLNQFEKGASSWWYQSCMSHGCEPTGGAGFADDGRGAMEAAEFRGWPSYMIDAPATAARAMGALAFANGIRGELYFDTVYAYDVADPWTSQWAFAGNGDGTLFYPGTPDRIGGKHDVPVESLRLVQVGLSIADYGYLALCEQLGDPSLARAEARALAPSLRSFSRDPRAYDQMREHLASRIEALIRERKLGSR